MDPSEINKTVNEAMRAATKGIGDACDEADSTLQTQKAKHQYDEAVLAGDDDGARDALDSAGNLLSTGFHKIRYKTGEYVGDKFAAARTRMAAPITPETSNFVDFLADRGRKNEDLGLNEQGKIVDKNVLLESNEFKDFFGNANYRMKGFRQERVTTAADEVSSALKSDQFAKIFDDKNQFGRIISRDRMDQIDDFKVKKLAKQYNRAVRASMVNKVARKLVNAEVPKEAIEKYIEDGANEVRSTMGALHRVWGNAMDKLPAGTKGISPEMDLAITQELLGESSGNAQASRFASVIKNELYPLKQDLMADAGINYEKRNNYLPTRHSASRIAAAGRENYVGKTLNFLDLGAMDLGDRDARDYLERVYQGFEERAGGNNIDNLESTDSTAIQQRKKLVFKDAESYREYHRLFGKDGNILQNLSEFIDETAHQVTSARRYADPDGFHVFKDLVNSEMKERQDIGYAGRLSVGQGDEALVRKLKLSKSRTTSSLLSAPPENISSELDALAKSGVIDPQLLSLVRSAANEDELAKSIRPFSRQFTNFLDFVERKASGELPMHDKTLGDKTYNWIAAGARGSLYAAMGVKGLLFDVGQRALANSQTADIASSIADTITLGNTSEAHLNAIGMITKEQMRDLELKSRAFSDNATRNKFEAAAMRLNFTDLYAESTQSAVRTGLLYTMTENLDKEFSELPEQLRNGISKKAWDVFRKIDEKGDDFLLDNDKKMVFKNPSKILNGFGFNDVERNAAQQIQAFVDNEASKTSQLADETTRIQRAQVQSTYADNALERAIHSSIFGVSNIMKAFSRKTAPLMLNLIAQGRYGTISGLVLFSTMLGALNKTTTLLIEGKRPNAKYFEDPSFWLDSMDMGGLVTNWAVATALQVHDSQDFKSAVASTMYGSGLQASYDLYQMSGNLLTGNTKGFERYAKNVLDNDFSLKRVPVGGLIAQKLIMDPIVNALDPNAAMVRQRAVTGANKRNTPYYFQ